jgi:hypothetical protein
MDDIAKICELEGLLELERSKLTGQKLVRHTNQLNGVVWTETPIEHSWYPTILTILKEYRAVESTLVNDRPISKQTVADDLSRLLFAVYQAFDRFGIDGDATLNTLCERLTKGKDNAC